MKKILFSLIIGFSIFLFPGMIKAFTIDANFKTVDYSELGSEEMNMLNEFFDYWDVNFPEYRYFAYATSKSTINIRYIKTNQVSADGFKIVGTQYNSSASYLIYNFQTVGFPNFGSYNIDITFDSSNTGYIGNRLSQIKTISNPSQFSNKNSITASNVLMSNSYGVDLTNTFITQNYTLNFIRSNIDGINTYLGTDFSILGETTETDTYNLVYHGTQINEGDNVSYSFDSAPKVDITIKGKEEHAGITLQYTLELKFTKFDTDKYIYEYAIDSGSESSFIDISDKMQDGKYEYVFKQNGYIVARIRDRETGEYITSTTMNIVDIDKFVYNNTIYNNYIKIPVTDIYDSTTGTWKTKQYVFMADKNYNLTPKIEFYFYLKDQEETESSNPVPLLVYVNNNILDIQEYIEKIASSPTSDPDGYGGGFGLSGGSFGGGGGGGRFDDEEDLTNACTVTPFSYNLNMNSFLHYATVTINFSQCQDLTGKTPDNFTTEYIYIFYNGKLYTDVYEAIDDNLIDNTISGINTDNIFDYFNSFNNQNSDIKIIINDIWNELKKSQISTYILILISGTLIIVVINAINR